MSQSNLGGGGGGSGDITAVTAGTNLDGGGTSGAVTLNLSTETVQDIVGSMVSGGTETRCTVSYDDTAGKLNFVVDDMSTDNDTTYTTSAVDSGNNAIVRLTGSDSSTDDITLVAGSNVSITPSGDNITITSSHPSISAASSSDNSGRTYIQDVTLDSNGHVTGLVTATETVTDTNQQTTFTVSATTDTTPTTISQGDDLFFAAGTGITCETTADGTVTVSSTVSDTNQLTTFDLGVDTNTNATTIAHGETLTLTGGTNITTETTADGTVTIDGSHTHDSNYRIGSLTDITGTGDTSGWSAGDHIAVADASDSNNSKRIKLPAEIGVACSDEATAITTTGDKATLMVPRGMRITEVKANVTVAETSTSAVVNVKYHASTPSSATSIFSDSNGCTIAANAYKNNRVLFTDGDDGSQAYYDVAEDGFIVVSVEGTAPTDAKGLKVWLLGYWS